MVFSAEPNPTSLFDWQETQILVPTKARRKRVSFGPQAGSWAHTESPDGESDSQEIDSLCGLISGRCGAVLRLKAIRDRLSNTPALEATRIAMIPGISGTTLGKLMEDFKLQGGMRPVLAYAVAKAVWHYYDSDWMTVGITSNRIFFMEEDHGEGLAHFCKPYLAVDLWPSHHSVHDWTPVLNTMHRWPRVLALGIMLIEIATGHSIDIEGPPENWDPGLVNSQLSKLNRIVKDGESFQEDCNNPCYRAVVKKCLDPRIFKAVSFNPRKPIENRDKRQEVLYNEVVVPLRKFIRGAGWDEAFENIETTPLKPKTSETFSRPVNDAISRPVAASLIESSSQCEDRAWLEKVADLNYMIQQEKAEVEVKTNAVRIAILDTGYDQEAPTFADDKYVTSKRIRKWRDFVSEDSAPVDEDGHGTHLLALFFRMRCSAHIYVARVTKNSDGVSEAEENIAEAIRVAAIQWNVDFVSMSLGFPRFSKKIKAAISDAQRHNEHITFFAAANNEGLNQSEMYPAKLGEAQAVIPIRGTYCDGSFHPQFNPPLSSTTPVFGTLGYNVHSDWPGMQHPQPMSGCSVATPIAVALAVMLIDYASSRPDHFRPDDLSLMRTRRGVFEIFRGMRI